MSETRQEYGVGEATAAGLLKPVRRRKYGNVPTACSAKHLHDSKLEARRCNELRLLQAAGEIEDLEVQPPFMLQTAFRNQTTGRIEQAIVFIPDFSYQENGVLTIEDVKGGKATRTAVFEIKRKMFLYQNPGAVFRIVTE